MASTSPNQAPGAPDARAGALASAQRLLAQGRRSDAVGQLRASIRPSDAFGAGHALLLDLLLQEGRRVEADAVFQTCLENGAQSARATDALAFYARRLDHHELSAQLYARAVELAPADAQARYNFAAAVRGLGRLSEAYDACAHALALDRGFLPALLMRSELSTVTPQQNHINDLAARLATDPRGANQIFAGYALGKELHDLGRYADAFEAFARAAAARRAQLSYDVGEDERKLRRIAKVFRGDPNARPATGPALGRHIFIVGLPRSGTTLVERILGALPGVRSNGETDNFANALMQCAPPEGEDVFARCAAAPPAAVADLYDRLAERPAAGDRVIEKLPLNYLYLGAIAAALPDSPIIWVRRDPVDSCFAMFRTLFGEGYPFSYDFDDLARYYAAYDRLMQHWAVVLPGRLIAVQYEDLVHSPARIAREVAERCGLSWTDEALDLRRNAAPSLTASAAQVRGGIYASSAGIGARYAAQLAGLAGGLQRLGVTGA